MKNAIVFLNGDPPTKEDLIEAAELACGATVICADGAYEYIYGIIEPDILLGAFDSITKKTNPTGAEILRNQSEKDYIDGFL